MSICAYGDSTAIWQPSASGCNANLQQSKSHKKCIRFLFASPNVFGWFSLCAICIKLNRFTLNIMKAFYADGCEYEIKHIRSGKMAFKGKNNLTKHILLETIRYKINA